MIRTVSYASSSIVFLTASLLIMCNSLFAQTVSFDCPAVASANSVFQSGATRYVEVPLAFSARCDDGRIEIDAIRAEVCWNREAYPLTDYGPRTESRSDVAGTIDVEERVESNLSFNGSLKGGYLNAFGTPSLNADASRKKSTSNKYARIPHHKPVISSGPIKRGTGAYFEFYPNRTDSLEGGRNLVVAFEVPASWKAGILQITCHAAGTRKRMGIFNDGFSFSRIFIVPVYLKGDGQAFRAATAVAQREQQLRSLWQRHRNGSSSRDTSAWWSANKQATNENTDLWMHHLIQSGSNRALRQVESQLPERVLFAANQFDRAREELFMLGR